jgi:hypothetical protein
VLVFVCAFGALLATDSLAIRAGIFPDTCFYKLAREVPSEVDVLIVGSSRMRRGIDPDQLASLLGIPKLRVINFGHGGSVLDTDYLLVDDFLRTRKIALVLVEANIEPKLDARTQVGYSTYPYTRYFIQFATLRQLLVNPFIPSDQPVGLRLYDSLNLLLAKMESAARSTFSGRLARLLWRKKNKNSDLADRPNICWHTRFEDGAASEARLQKAENGKKRRREEFYATHGDWLEDGFFASVLFVDRERQIQVAFMRQIVRLAEEHGSRIAFINLRQYFTWPPGPEFVKEFDERIGAPLLVPDKEFLQSIQQNGYRDSSHLSAAGRSAYTTWLAQQLTTKDLWR